ncbi:alpha/beta hydrolase [Arenibacter sp. F26102]|uniref:alpha/beta fold hydrolase n=1 Tax=Arenibacter sp. F26102 TaxID=2926416 RepID=UPI001FF46037|nr:alpha/beta hydrolase [Arenibacter sp. F26102]MCK0148180.1 alpha/beta hydrolase [Arenibacter sp. F26102]
MKTAINKTLFVLMLIATFIGKGQTTKVDHVNLQKTDTPLTFLFVHGAWGGGWEYAKMDSILTKKGHNVFHPTLTGLGERVHLANKEINLTTHITDIVNVIKFENLESIILVGHSYGGMVISGVAENIPERIDQLIYLDAFVPNDGESVESINGEEVWNVMIVPKINDGFVLYPFGPTKATPPTDVPQPLKTFTEALTIKNPLVKKIPTSFILMKEDEKATFEEWGAKKALLNGWKIYEMEGGHYAMRDQPEKLVEKLELILRDR